MNIQKNADDISKILGNVKLEFSRFGDMLAKAQKQLNTASKTSIVFLTQGVGQLLELLIQLKPIKTVRYKVCWIYHD
mgnify:CR=1 FL=1